MREITKHRASTCTAAAPSRAAARRRAQHPEDDVAAAAQHGVLAVDLAQRAEQRGVARAGKAAGDDLAPAAVPAVVGLPREELVRHPIEAAAPAAVGAAAPLGATPPVGGEGGGVGDPLGDRAVRRDALRCS
eukprot:scaffold85587_cov42-Phaeocystis_antarctica.AAC.3